MSTYTDTKRFKPEDRGPDGRFTPGSPAGPGNPHVARVGELTSALLQAVTPEDMREIVQALVAAVRIVFDRVLGRPLVAENAAASAAPCSVLQPVAAMRNAVSTSYWCFVGEQP